MKIVDVARHLLSAEERHDLFSMDRLVLLLYLVDWKAALDQQGGIDGLDWSVTQAGLTMTSTSVNGGTIEALQEMDGRLTVGQVVDALPERVESAPLSPAELRLVEFVHKASAGRSWESLFSLVMSTEPLLAAHREVLDLDQSAADRRQTRRELELA